MLEQNEKDKKEASEEKFDLYTENIVEKPWVKYRRLVHFVLFIGGAVLFGVIAAFVASLLYPLISENQNTSEQAIVIETDPPLESAGVLASQEEIPSETRMDEAQIIEKTQRSMVQIKTDKGSYKEPYGISESGGSPIFPSSTGIILVAIENEYYIVTRYTDVESAKKIVVKFNDGSVCQAALIDYHRETNIAVLYAEMSEAISTTEVRACVLGNSYVLRQGQQMFMLGKIYGSPGALNYGVCTGSSALLEMPDLNVGIIATSLPNQPGDDGFLFDEAGRLIGVGSEVENGSGCVLAYGISDLRPLLEKLINRQAVPYAGIYGTTVTEEIKVAYGLPDGIFISQVELASPAFAGGLQPGDVIVAVNGNAVSRMPDLSGRIYACRPGQELVITAKRPGKENYHEFDFVITLGALESH